MTRQYLTLSLVALLAACGDGQPFDFGTGGELDPDDDGTTSGDVPEVIGNNVDAVEYDAANGTFEVTVTSLDTTPANATYNRTPQLDVPGYTAFSIQEDPLDRFFIALAANSTDGSTTGAVVLDGGQFNKVFGGAYFERTGSYSPHVPDQPDNGLVSYAGEYAGLSNIFVPEGNPANLTDDTGTAGLDPDTLPKQASTVTGDVFLNADFTDNTINGAITDREIVELGIALPNVILVAEPGNIDAGAGTFAGTAEAPDQTVIGDYAGIFGGDGATSLSGAIKIEGYLDGVENELEYGIFVLTKCGEPGDAALCDIVNPDAVP